MSWTKPKIVEIPCGMEINMYFPAEDERRQTEKLPTASKPK